MPNESFIDRIEQQLDDIARLGGQSERTAIFTNVLVIDASPAGLTGRVIIRDPRDGNYIPALTVPGIVYNNNDLVNVLFLEGTEPLAFQQGSGSSTATGLWQLEGGTGPDIYYDAGKVGIGTSVIPHGGVGAAMLQLDGTTSSDDGPHVQVTTSEDNHPAFQIYTASHDSINVLFDSYIVGGGSKSGDAGSNFQIRKAGDLIRMRYANGVAQGGAITWADALVIDLSNGANILRAVDLVGTSDAAGSTEILRLDTSLGIGQARTWAFMVVNSSGSAASSGDVGYLDENNQYQTTTTAEDEKANPVVVVTGGANGANIYVTKGPGRFTLNYTGSAPSSGDYLTFSGTAGKCQARSTMHYAVLATASAAGGGGTVQAELLLQRRVINIAPSDFMFRVDLAADSDFVALIDSLPGGALVRYDTPTSGAENVIVPNAATNFAKMVLHNTTRGDYALIDTTDTTGGAGFDGEITLTAAVPGTWMATDTITVRSQTNTDVQGTSYWIDLEFEDTTIVPELVTKLFCQVRWVDTGGVGESMATHPFKANNVPDQRFTNVQVANQAIFQRITIPLIQRRFQLHWTASGAATARPRLRLTEVEMAV